MMAENPTYEELTLRIESLKMDAWQHERDKADWQESEKKFWRLFDYCPMGIFIYKLTADNNNLVLLRANQAAEIMFGVNCEQFIGNSIEAAFPPLAETIIPAKFREVAANGKTWGGEHIDYTHDKISATFKVVAFQTKANEMACMFEDITEQKKAETALGESERKYKTLIENANSVILRWEPNGRIIYLNPYGLDFFKYKKDEAVGAQVMGTIVPEEESSGRNLREMIKDIANNPLKYKNNLNQNMCSDGKRVWLQWTNVAIFDATGKFAEILSIGNDVTEKVLAEEALRSREKQLKAQAQHLEEVNTAMKVLLKKREEDKNELEEKVLLNVRELVVNYLETLKHSGLDDKQKTYVDIIDANLNDIVSPFLKRLAHHYGHLTPTEVGVAKLLKQGKTTKEIASLFNLSPRTIEFHRGNIRKKMGIKNKKTNLRTHLLSID